MFREDVMEEIVYFAGAIIGLAKCIPCGPTPVDETWVVSDYSITEYIETDKLPDEDYDVQGGRCDLPLV
jgi:hypothetical protein